MKIKHEHKLTMETSAPCNCVIKLNKSNACERSYTVIVGNSQENMASFDIKYDDLLNIAKEITNFVNKGEDFLQLDE